MRTIYSSNFEGLRTMLAQWRQNGSLPFWNWSNFPGNDFYSSKLLYFNDLWEYLFALGDLPYTTAILWMTYLRFLSGAFSFYAYARYNHAGHRVSILASLFWAFSSYMLQVMRDPFFRCTSFRSIATSLRKSTDSSSSWCSSCSSTITTCST